MLKHQVRQNQIDDEICSPEQLDHLAKTRQNLAELEKELAILSKDLELERLQGPLVRGGEPSDQLPSLEDGDHMVPGPQFFFQLELCQCNFSSVTHTSSLPLCQTRVLDLSSGLDLCLAVDSDKINIKELRGVELVVPVSNTDAFVVVPVDPRDGPQDTVVKYFGKFASLRTMTTVDCLFSLD